MSDSDYEKFEPTFKIAERASQHKRDYVGELYVDEDCVTIVPPARSRSSRREFLQRVNVVRRAFRKQGGLRPVVHYSVRDTMAFHKSVPVMLKPRRDYPLPVQKIPNVARSTSPRHERLNEAIANLEAAFEDAQHADWNDVLDAAVAAKTLDARQVEQAGRHAEMRSTLKNNFTFFNSQEFAAIAPGLVSESNVMRVLTKAVTEHKVLLGMKEGGKWIYPACQIDPKTGDIFKDLKPIIKQGYDQGQTAWEIMWWLVTPSLDVFAEPGRPVEMGDVFDEALFLREMNRREQAPSVANTHSPLDLLNSGEIEAFQSKGRAYLGG